MLELSMMNADASAEDFDDVIVDALNQGLPAELVLRLRDFWTATKKIGNEVVAIGKIIVMAIIRFLKENRELAIGVAIGAAIAFLVASIPILGPFLAPYVAVLAPMYCAGYGAAQQAGQDPASPLAVAFALASKFFELLKLVFSAVSERWTA
jgi:hypothetical protein